MPSLFLLLLLLLILLTISIDTVPVAVNAQRPGNANEVIEDAEISYDMPDVSDRIINQKMKCSACKVLAKLFGFSLRQLRDKRGNSNSNNNSKSNRIKSFHLLEATQSVCDRFTNELRANNFTYGLEMLPQAVDKKGNPLTSSPKGKPPGARWRALPRFVNLKIDPVARGAWPTTFLLNVCGEIISDHQDFMNEFDIINLGNRKFAEQLCGDSYDNFHQCVAEDLKTELDKIPDHVTRSPEMIQHYNQQEHDKWEKEDL